MPLEVLNSNAAASEKLEFSTPDALENDLEQEKLQKIFEALDYFWIEYALTRKIPVDLE